METRPLQLSDIERVLEIRARSFGVLPEAHRPSVEKSLADAINQDRAIGVVDGGRLVARGIFWRFEQWWGGRAVPMGGVAGVTVAPEYRGRGVGSLLMRGLIDLMRDQGYPLAALYPATVPPYRNLGWEIAGCQYRFTFDAGLLRALRGGSMPVRQGTPDDAAALLDVMSRGYATGHACGPKSDTETDLREQLADPSVFTYVCDDGFVVYGWQGWDLEVQGLHARTPEAARALWSTVGSGSSIAKHVYAFLAPDDPVHHLVRETDDGSPKLQRWMLRLLDVSPAVRGRGYPAGVNVEVPVDIDDAQVPANRCQGVLRVADGFGELVAAPVAADAVRLGPNGLAALYAGTSTATLARAGLVSSSDPAHLAALDAAFAGRPAYLLEYF